MPIKPENRARYPSDWPQIRERILLRAGSRCEWPGCGAHHRALGYWLRDAWVPLPHTLREAGVVGPCTIAAKEGPLKIIRIVLTVAHLDHTPEHCSDENLRAWCQRHHLAYDQQHHNETAYATKMARRGNMELPL
jgi:hypothetical protein